MTELQHVVTTAV